METNLLLHHYNLQVVSDIDAMATVVEWFNQFNNKQISYQTWLEGQTALLEGFTNVVRHAHKHLSPETLVDLEVQMSPEYFQICIWDQGDVFDLEAAIESFNQETSQSEFNPLDHEFQWGCIFFLKLREDYGWTISYTRNLENRNCLLLKKQLGIL
ncbi:anti-sigma regulatory factor [Anabaena cylindrica FACHB-243]|uniref:Anti-sigma regulatory factor, serine/threonine protein kinase n=1 Tax=Anabaena cylindrica (strain ATCC 27899 / PCC 7122) TaxID=272123 RepID=K9ZIQ3_ANACC|nr:MULTISPECIES: anti-sigma regulatory factor [Anabaena]AFZ58644.1 putative anti-sigma regulatory factor, serine/threonine protein kinase [Anabaena cylindrica PCC 7122]MBD2419989.1 anti-sigma regulatory factor [Anabaena cylindrica FACHB-243]MBY5282897.1 anti-sigma regulatory factor [Anabaena sp. CCAP 1446/1C]MBY5310393.1 anti-sigma regulatory factor [Anabaena sp. CCAP 1446/1C]MCM2407117.1 anti-sigma regulatory factor [Anabaena sp. CCAP 1446/1C]